MHLQSKILVGVCSGLVLAGVWYVSQSPSTPGDPVSPNPVATEAKAPESTEPKSVEPPVMKIAAPQPKTPIAETPSAETPANESSANASGVASPVPPTIDTSAKNTPMDAARPTPTPTNEPTAPATAPESSVTSLPPAAALSTITPTIIEAPAASADEALPPNVVANPAPAPLTVRPTTQPTAVTAAPVAAPAPSMPSIASPAATPSTAAPAVKPAAKTHVVKAGETYTSIAVKHYGHAKYASHLMKANPKIDAKRLYVGAKINVPELPAEAAKPAAATAAKTDTTKTDATKADGKVTASTDKKAAAGKKIAKDVVTPPDPSRSYTVQPGDGWYSLARKFLGNGSDYPELYELNKERVNNNPDLLRPGLVIELPKRAKMPAADAKPATDKPAAK